MGRDRTPSPPTGTNGKALAKVPTMTMIWADGGYSGPMLASALKELDIDAGLEIVRKNKDAKGFDILPRRWVVERTFAWMGRCRRLSKDYERRTDTSMGWVTLSACRFLMRRIAREMGKLEMESVQS